MIDAVAGCILAPLAGAILTFLSPSRATRQVAIVAALGTLALGVVLATDVASHGTIRFAIGDWAPPLGIRLRADGVAAALVAIAGVVGTGVVAHASTYLSHHERHFFPLWLAGWAAVNALALSADVFNLYVSLELLTMSAVGLVVLGHDQEAFRAALRYLLVAMAGSLAYLLGVALLYGAYATLDIALLAERAEPTSLTITALAAMTVGVAAKAALFPLHGWLPAAHANAPAPASAVLSGLIVKGAFVVALRLWVDLAPDLLPVAGPGLALLGAGAVAWGSALALRQPRLKLLVAYSTVAQIGYLFLGFGVGTPAAIQGAVYLALAHAAAKASLFLAAGTIVHAVGHDDLARLDGVARRLPLTFAAISLAAVSLVGLPPTGGFVGKWLLLRAAVEQGAWGWAAVLLAGGLLTAAYCLRVLRGAFLPLAAGVEPKQPPRTEEGAAFGLALVALLLGLLPTGPIALLGAR